MLEVMSITVIRAMAMDNTGIGHTYLGSAPHEPLFW